MGVLVVVWLVVMMGMSSLDMLRVWGVGCRIELPLLYHPSPLSP